jgi:hypothetical protein
LEGNPIKGFPSKSVRWRLRASHPSGILAIAAIGVIVLAACAAVRSGRPPTDSLSLWDAKKIEAFLKTARIAAVQKDLEQGRTLPWRVVLDDGTTKATAMFKHVHRPRPHPFPDSYKYEIAAYELDRLLGLDVVPPTVERVVDGAAGALQWYLEGCVSERNRERAKLQPPDLDAFLKQLDEVKIFEALAGDECQDKDDTLIHRERWKVCRVDFSEAFAASSTIAEGCPIERCSRRLFDRLREISRAELATRLRSHLSRAELDALRARQGRILSRLRALIREKGERAVIY